MFKYPGRLLATYYRLPQTKKHEGVYLRMAESIAGCDLSWMCTGARPGPTVGPATGSLRLGDLILVWLLPVQLGWGWVVSRKASELGREPWF